jgi:anaerobic selenocysteine-containing dehydrogenase
MREAISFCRICTAWCGTRVTIADNERIVAIRGNHDDPVHRGYACYKGTHATLSLYSSDRLLRPLKRNSDGQLREIGLEHALDGVAHDLRAIIDKHGSESVGMFMGNGGFPNSSSLHWDFMDALGSTARFSTVTIDAGAQFVVAERLGVWGGGKPRSDDADVALVFGSNGMVSHSTIGILDVDPVKRLKDAKARGLRLIVVDPRRTKTAEKADLFLQPYPGQDTAIIAALLNLIIKEGWHDTAFCEAHVGAQRMASLCAAILPFTPEIVEYRAGLRPGQIRAVAEMFARDGRRGISFGFTGINMGPQSNLAAHLLECLNVICGYYIRAGESYRDFNPMVPLAPRYAEVVPPTFWKGQQRSRIRGIGLAGERNSGTLADEILTPGRDQVRAMIVIGGNPANSVPNQYRIVEALKSLELLVVIDPFLTNTARLADYVLPPTMFYERNDIPLGLYGANFWPVPWAQYAPALVAPPAGSEVVDSWYVLWGVAKRLGLSIKCGGTPLDMVNPPTTDDIFTQMLSKSAITFSELKAAGGPVIVGGDTPLHVLPARPEAAGALFDVMPPDVAAELSSTAAERVVPGSWSSGGQTFSHLLAVRRLPFVYNTQGSSQPVHRQRTPYNAAFLHPEDLVTIGTRSGGLVTIRSDNGTIAARVESDETVRRGVVSMSHGWGGLPDDDEGDGPRGASVNRLISDKCNSQILNAMPRMTAVPVTITAISDDASRG